MTKDECQSLLNSQKVCSDGVRYDHLQLWGITNPNMSQYTYSSTGGGFYYSFSPNQDQKFNTMLAPFVGKSVSFPKPDITSSEYTGVGASFTGSTTNWYVYNFAKGTSSDSFSSFAGVPVESFLFDEKQTKMYDPSTPQAQIGATSQPPPQKDYDLSSSAKIDTSSSDPIRYDDGVSIRSALGGFKFDDVAVNDKVYYGLRTTPDFNEPSGVSMDSNSNMYVADTGNDRVVMISKSTGKLAVLGSAASPAFKKPFGLTVVEMPSPSPTGAPTVNILVADSGNSLIRAIMSAGTSTETVVSLGSSLVFKNPRGVAFNAADGYIWVADTDNDRICYLSPTQGWSVGDCLITASPLSKPSGLAVTSSNNNKYLVVADSFHGKVRKISYSQGGNALADNSTAWIYNTMDDLGKAASPPFGPYGVSIDGNGNVYVADSYLSLVRVIDPVTDVVTSIGTSAKPAMSKVLGLWVDSKSSTGDVLVADAGNNLIRKIKSDASGEKVTRVIGRPNIFSWDLRNSNPTSLTVWPDAALAGTLHDVDLVDSTAGGCQNVDSSYSQGFCFLLTYSEFNQELNYLVLEFQLFSTLPYLFSIFVTLDVSTKTSKSFLYKILGVTPSRQLWASFQTTTNGLVLFTSKGAAQITPASSVSQADPSNIVYLSAHSKYTDLVTATGTSVVSCSKIPGNPPRYLQLLLNQKDLYTMITYDTATDTYFSTPANSVAASTHYMLAYTWGVCDQKPTRSLVELTFSNDYSNECQLPLNGIYYQSENRYYTIPFSCLGIAPDRLLTDCDEVATNMKSLVASTCSASIPKVCEQQYDLNPPFSCVQNTYPDVLTVLSLAFSNTTALAAFMATLVGVLLSRMHKQYAPTQAELDIVNPPSTSSPSSSTLLSSDSDSSIKLSNRYTIMKRTDGDGGDAEQGGLEMNKWISYEDNATSTAAANISTAISAETRIKELEAQVAILNSLVLQGGQGSATNSTPTIVESFNGVADSSISGVTGLLTAPVGWITGHTVGGPQQPQAQTDKKVGSAGARLRLVRL